jgi:hypothetical protein
VFAGAEAGAGVAATTAVAAEVAVVEPPLFVAVTPSLIVAEASAEASA